MPCSPPISSQNWGHEAVRAAEVRSPHRPAPGPGPAHLGADLVPALACLDVHDFPHGRAARLRTPAATEARAGNSATRARLGPPPLQVANESRPLPTATPLTPVRPMAVCQVLGAPPSLRHGPRSLRVTAAAPPRPGPEESAAASGFELAGLRSRPPAPRGSWQVRDRGAAGHSLWFQGSASLGWNPG